MIIFRFSIDFDYFKIVKIFLWELQFLWLDFTLLAIWSSFENIFF